MAGDSQTGGGGSVHWSIDVDKADFKRGKTLCVDHGEGRFHQRGRDGDNRAKRFTISIRIPDSPKEARSLQKLLGGVGAKRGRFTFTLPIERHKDQIRISWGTKGVPTRSARSLSRHVAAKPAAT